MAGLLSGLNSMLFGEAPKYKAPQSVIGAGDIDRLIELMRTQGTKSIMDALGESKQQGAEFMAGQGLAGTGGIPAQMWSQLQGKAFGQLGEMETNLGGLKFNSLMQLQQLMQQQAMQQYQADMGTYQEDKSGMGDILDLGGSFAMLKYLSPKEG
jgi:hypothetical protein